MSYILNNHIYYEEYGTGNENTLLYIHGGPGASCLDFRYQAKKLGENLRVIIFDQLGVLRSEAIKDDEEYGMDIQVKMIEEMRKNLNISKWSILGHSYGGSLAALYAYTYPESVDKILLECPSLDFIDSAKSTAEYLREYFTKIDKTVAVELCDKIKNTQYTDKTVAEDLMTLLDYVEDMKIRNYLHNITFEEYLKYMEDDTVTDEMWGKTGNHVMKLMEEGKMFHNFLPLLFKAGKSVLLLNGKYDPACSLKQINYMKSNVKDITQVIFEESGHFPRIEEPQKYTNSILEFMK